MSIGENLKTLRKERLLTQKQLADKIGISRSFLSDIENDRKSPSMETVALMSRKLKVSIDYLATGEKTIKDVTEESQLKKEVNSIFTELRMIRNEIQKTEESIINCAPSECNQLRKHLDSLKSRHIELKRQSKENPEIVRMLAEERWNEMDKEKNIYMYKDRFHVRIEDFLQDERKSFYIDDHKLTHEEIKMLVTLYGGKEKNYPTDEQIEKEYEAIRKEKVKISEMQQKAKVERNSIPVIDPYHDIETN